MVSHNRPKPDRATSRAVALDVREALSGKFFDGGMQGVHARSIARPRALRHGNKILNLALRPLLWGSAMTGMFERLRHSQFADPIWQPVIFAVLLLLISVTLVLIITT
jgi:hypothetical protein